MSCSHYDILFERYIAICNEALAHNKEVFPYNCVVQAMNTLPSANIIVVDDIPKGLFKIFVENGHIHVKNMNKDSPTQQVFRLNLSAMQHVVENPDEYINNPSKINWSWLQSS